MPKNKVKRDVCKPIKRKGKDSRLGHKKQERAKERGTLIVVITLQKCPFPSVKVLRKADRKLLDTMRILRANMLDCVETPIVHNDTLRVESKNVNDEVYKGTARNTGSNCYRVFFSVPMYDATPLQLIGVLNNCGIREIYTNQGKSGFLGRIGIGGQNPDNPAPSKLPARCYSGAIARKLEREERDSIARMGFLNYVYGTSFPDSSMVPYKGIELTMMETLEIVARKETNSPLPSNWNTTAEKLAFWHNALTRHFEDYCTFHLTSARLSRKNASSNAEIEYWTKIEQAIRTYVEHFGSKHVKDQYGKPLADGKDHAAFRAENVENIVKEEMGIDMDVNIREVIIVDGIPTRIARKPTPQASKLQVTDDVLQRLDTISDEPIKNIEVPLGKNMPECIRWWNDQLTLEPKGGYDIVKSINDAIPQRDDSVSKITVIQG